MQVTSGLEVLLRDGHPLVDGRRVGLLTHPAGVDRGLRSAVEVPTMSKHAGERCRGIELYVTDREAARPTELGLALLEDCIAVSGDHLEWREAAFDRLAGDPVVRETLQRRASLDPLITRWRDEACAFTQRRARHLLYADDGLS